MRWPFFYYKVFSCNQSFIFFLGFLSCFLFQIPFSCLCVFLLLSSVFVQHQCFWFRNKQVNKTQIIGQEGGCNKRFFVNLCFAECEKLSFWGAFFGKFWLSFKKQSKNRYFNTFLKAKDGKSMTIFKSHYLGQRRVIIWAKLVSNKESQLGPDNNYYQLRAHFFLQQKIC